MCLFSYQELARDTNVMTNMMPEAKNNFLWNRLEEYCRDCLTKDYQKIYVMSGTLFLREEVETTASNDGLGKESLVSIYTSVENRICACYNCCINFQCS